MKTWFDEFMTSIGLERTKCTILMSMLRWTPHASYAMLPTLLGPMHEP